MGRDSGAPVGPWRPDTLLRLVRYDFTASPGGGSGPNPTPPAEERTIGKLWINPAFVTSSGFQVDPINSQMFTCEDADRGLDVGMPDSELRKRKLPHFTAIPVTSSVFRYRLIWRWSPKHKCHLPGLEVVPMFRDVEIHAGNKPADTDACLLPGLLRGPDSVFESRAACHDLYPLVEEAVTRGPCYLEVERDEAAWVERLRLRPELAYPIFANMDLLT